MNRPLDPGRRSGGLTDPLRLDAMRTVADPLADDIAARIVGPWAVDPSADAASVLAANGSRWERIASANRAIAAWSDNGQLATWQPHGVADPDVANALAEYLRAGAALPEWADHAKIARAEELFFDYGPLSCVLLFCASLPECYVVPDLSAVLHASGQLEQHTDYRVRMTAAMIFPVMMHGGLTTNDGGGIAQILKVRLIHATIRNLILRGHPDDAPAAVAPLASPVPPKQMHQVLFSHGWNVQQRGLPCNQEELAYTLLTFSYVFLRSLRQLNLALPNDDEEAYLHCWNVVGHVLGIRRELMADTMADAEALFNAMQARGCENPPTPDVRPALGQALIDAMASSITLPIVRHFPELMTARLCGPQARSVGVDGHAPLSAKLLFAVTMGVARVVDGVCRMRWPDFSISRLVTRIVGYHLLTTVLLDQTCPLTLPDHLLNRVDETMATWGEDRKAPHWLNVVEDWLTTRGTWRHRRAAVRH
ncbi:MAG: oxygenase MpaB family protein [Vicinamibacterales bacterium]